MISTQRLWLPFTLPTFNDFEAARGQRDRIFGNGYARMKYELQSVIVGFIRRQRLKPIDGKVSMLFTWIEADRRRDPYDLPGGARKVIVDALCEPDRPGDRQPRAGIIHCDGWHCMTAGGLHDLFEVDRANAGVAVALYGTLRR